MGELITRTGTLSTLDDIENYLEELSKTANESAEAALQAQMQVLRYVQSAKLYDSSFDMFFKCIKNALQHADSPTMKMKIREQASIMVQNYVFFMDAKLQYESEVNRQTKYALIADASKMLSESISAVIILASSSKNQDNSNKILKASITKSIENALTPQNGNDSMFTKIVRWWTKEQRISAKEDEFITTLDKLTRKLYKQRNIIGKSDLIAGIIERYADDMTDHLYGQDLHSALTALTECKKKFFKRLKVGALLILTLNIIILFIRWFFKALQEGANKLHAKFTDTEYIPDTSHWALTQWYFAIGLFALLAIIWYIIYIINNKRNMTYYKEAQKEYDDAYQKYMNMASEFEE